MNIYFSEQIYYSRINAMHSLTNSKNKIIKYYYFDKKTQSTHAKTQPNIQPMRI